MKNEVANDIANYIEKQGIKVNDVYFDNICRDVNNYFDMSNLPLRAYTKYIDLTQSSSGISKLVYEISEHIDLNNNVLVSRSSNEDNLYIASSIIGKYIGDCIIKNKRIHKVLYIDTPLLLSDYKKLMDLANNINPPVLFHDIETLNKDIYWYDYVIWDRFNCINSGYDLNKLHEIIHHRYLNLCGNLFFIVGKSIDERVSGITETLKSSMDISKQFTLLNDKCAYKNTEQYDLLINQETNKEVES